MKIFLLLITALTFVAGCSPSLKNPSIGDPPARIKNDSALGFNADELSDAIAPTDDFYAYVNGRWLEKTDIPAEWSSYGAMQILYEKTEQQVWGLIQEAGNQTNRTPGSDLQKIRDLYLSFMDESLVNELGIRPLDPELEQIEDLQSHQDLVRYFGHALAIGIQVPVNFYIDANAADTNHTLVYFWQDGLGLPDRDYYLSDTEKLAVIREQYLAHIERMFALAGWKNGAAAAEQIFAVENRIANHHWSRVQNRNREKIYSSKFDINSAEQLSGEFDWGVFLDAGGFGQPATFVIAQTDYFRELGAIINDVPMQVWRTYLHFKLLKSYAPYLNDAIVEEDFNFQKRILRGQEKIRPRWKRGVRLVNSVLGEMIGKMYVDRYFPPASKQRMDEMITNLREAYRQSIEELEWMGGDTKTEAQDKLDRFTSKIGYPEKWRIYSALEIRPDDLAGNVQRSRIFEHFWQIGKLSKPVDRTEWGMTPQTVNAYYRPTMNEIVFPAAILQPPFFDSDVDDAVNYGAIGAIVGHEFSHGFDDQGRKFDGAGLLSDWWTDVDGQEYVRRSAGLVAQYDRFQPLVDQNINGELTLGENIADLAGVIVAYRAYQLSLDGKKAPVLDGFTGDQRFFIGYAQGWRGKYREEYLREILLSDPHSPYQYRVIGVLRNVPEFYEAFQVTEGDGMFVAGPERVKIW